MPVIVDCLQVLQAYWPQVLAVLVTGYFIRARYQHGLSDIPGPFIASFTDLWQFYRSLRGLGIEDYKLHEKYNSPLVRVGPNTIAVSDPDACRIIFGYKTIFKKSIFYTASIQSNSKGELYQNLASTRDEDEHARLRRPVAHTYSLSTLLQYEPLIDSTIHTFFEQLDKRFVESQQECPMDRWLQMYAFDVIGELTFSHRLGFLETGTDIGNMMHYTAKMMNYAGTMGHLPYLDKIVRLNNPLIIRLVSMPVVRFTVEQIKEHRRNAHRRAHPDLVTRFEEASEKYPEIMDEDRIAENARSAVGAGSDTTAIVLRELLYQILLNPKIYETLRNEVKDVLSRRPQSDNSSKPIAWHEGNDMKYFQACIKESLRYHTPLGQMIPRDIPPGGITLCGRYIPEGVVVGCNGWTIHRDKAVYGENANEFDPERWLKATPEQFTKMDNVSIAFGGGSRICIGKNIALLEINKTIPEMLRRYEMELVDPTRYKSVPGWLVPQIGLDVRLKHRDQAE